MIDICDFKIYMMILYYLRFDNMKLIDFFIEIVDDLICLLILEIDFVRFWLLCLVELVIC